MLSERAGEIVEVDGRRFLRTKPNLSGHAVFGPYATLEPGRYSVEFSIRPLAPWDEKRDPLIAIADVTAGLVVFLYDALVFRSQLEDDQRYVVHFETERTLSGVECRLYVNGAEPLLIGDEPTVVEVKDAPPWSQPAPPLPLIAEHSDRVRSLFFSGAAIAAEGEALAAALAGRSFLARTPPELWALDSLLLTGPGVPEAPQGDGHTAALVVALGAPSAFGQTGYALVGHAMNAVYGGHLRRHCGSVAELRAQWDDLKGRPVLLTADQPDTALCYLLGTSGVPILAFFDDPAEAVTYRVAIAKQPLVDAIRFCSLCISCVEGFAGLEQTRIFDGGHRHSTLTEIVEAIFGALGVAPDTQVVAEVVERIAATEEVGAGATVAELVNRRLGGESAEALEQRHFDAAARALIGVFAASYGAFLRGVESDVVEWPLALFYTSTEGDNGERYVDLVGGARIVFFGPYLHLPFGRWRAVVQFEVTGNASGNEIEAEVWVVSTQSSAAKILTKLPRHGHFQFRVEFANANPKAVLEIRVRLVKGAIEGRFFVRRVTMEAVETPTGLVYDTPARRPGLPQDAQP